MQKINYYAEVTQEYRHPAATYDENMYRVDDLIYYTSTFCSRQNMDLHSSGNEKLASKAMKIVEFLDETFLIQDRCLLRSPKRHSHAPQRTTNGKSKTPRIMNG